MKLLPDCFNQRPLDIETFDGSDSPYHPSVIHVPQGWGGHRWWMVQTPFSPLCRPYRDCMECPQIYFSEDGITWHHPAGNTPIDRLTDAELSELDYLSDPHLLINEHGLMECWYRHTRRHRHENHRADVWLLRKTSADGVVWSDREYLAALAEGRTAALGDMIVSPAVIREEGLYKMWYVDSEGAGPRHVRLATSPDGREWSPSRLCTLDGHTSNPWHIDVIRDGESYVLTVYEFSELTLWRSSDGIRFQYLCTALHGRQAKGSYYYDLYRASLVKLPGGSYRLYFSSSDLCHTYIGYMEGNTLDALSVANPSGRKFRSQWQALTQEFIPRAWLSIKFRLKSLFNKSLFNKNRKRG